MNYLDTAIILGSLLVVIVVGLWAGRNQDKTARGYFLASGRIPWWIVGSAFVSTSVSSEQIVGTVGKAYESGMGVANWEWFCLPIYLPLIVFLLPVFLKNRITTVPDFLSRRFGPLCADIYTWIMLVAYVFVFMPPVLYGGTLTFSQLTGWNFHAVLWLMVACIAAYTVKGGLASVMWTDAIQCAMLMGGGVLLFFIALGQIDGGWSAMVAANPDRFHLYRPMNDPTAPFLGMIFAAGGVFLFYQAGNQVMLQRILGARTTWDGLMGVVFAGFVNFFRPLVTCFLGLVVYHWIHVMHQHEPLKMGDEAFPLVLQNLAPAWGLRGIVLMGFLAAVMSTASALANSTATIFSLDLYRKFINRDADDRRTIFMGRTASFSALLIAAMMAPLVAKFGGIFNYFQTGVTYLATPFISAILMGVFWRRANYASGLFGIIGGFAITLTVAFGLAPLLNYVYQGQPSGWIADFVFVTQSAAGKAVINVHWLYLAFIAQVITMAGMAVVAQFTAPPSPEQSQPFAWSWKVLMQYEEGRVRPWYQRLSLWLGIYSVIWTYLYWKFW